MMFGTWNVRTLIYKPEHCSNVIDKELNTMALLPIVRYDRQEMVNSKKEQAYLPSSAKANLKKKKCCFHGFTIKNKLIRGLSYKTGGICEWLMNLQYIITSEPTTISTRCNPGSYSYCSASSTYNVC